MTMANVVDFKKIESYNFVTHQEEIKEIPQEGIKVISFFSSTCPCSNSYINYLSELSQKNKDVTFIGFNSSKFTSKDISQKYFDEKKMSFGVFNDYDLKFADMFGALKTPHIFVLNKKNEVVYHGAVADSRHMEKANEFFLANVLSDLKNNKVPRYDFKNTLGCYISR